MNVSGRSVLTDVMPCFRQLIRDDDADDPIRDPLERRPMKPITPLLLAATLLLAACGNTTGDRALSGAAIGTGAGLAVGAVTGATLLQGAVVGGALGAAAGALTNSDQVNLGRPAWR